MGSPSRTRRRKTHTLSGTGTINIDPSVGLNYLTSGSSEYDGDITAGNLAMSGAGTFTLGTFGGAGDVTFGTATQSDGTLVVNDSLTILNSGGFSVATNASLNTSP